VRIREVGPLLLACGVLACSKSEPEAAPKEEPGAAPPKTTEPDAEMDAVLRHSIAKYGCKVLVGKATWAKQESGRFPATFEELLRAKSILDMPDDEDDVLTDTLRNDPWKHPYVYEVLDDHVKVTSAGPDGKLGTEDDLSATSK